MAELVDALVSGTSVRKNVQVRVLFWALDEHKATMTVLLFIPYAQVVELVDTLL